MRNSVSAPPMSPALSFVCPTSSKPMSTAFDFASSLMALRVSSNSLAVMRRLPLSNVSLAITAPPASVEYSRVSVAVPSFDDSFCGSVRAA